MEPLATEDGRPALAAYQIYDRTPMRLVPADSQRAWMDATRQRFAYRCLPLLMANQAGWFVLSGHDVRVTWSGGPELNAVTIEMLGGPPPGPALSHFGHGILTWTLPWLFRTSTGKS